MQPYVMMKILYAAALILGATTLLTPATSQATDSPLPAPVQLIEQQGVTIVGTFEGPDDITGYVGEYQGQGLTLYVTADGENAFIGTWLDAEGNDRGAEHIRRLVEAPRYANAWESLEQADWVAEGDADTIIYTFTDPFCPHCRRMHESLHSYVESGQIQVRHIMVGIIREASPAIAATILGSEDPTAALLEHMERIEDGGIDMNGQAMRAGQSSLRQHHEIMRSLNLSSTPVTFYKDSNDVVQMIQGAPGVYHIEAMLGR